MLFMKQKTFFRFYFFPQSDLFLDDALNVLEVGVVATERDQNLVVHLVLASEVLEKKRFKNQIFLYHQK